MTQRGQRQNCKFVDNVLVTMYYAHHFKVNATVNRFVFKLVGLCDSLFKNFYSAQADGSLLKVLQLSNSTRDYFFFEKQPKVIGLLFWMFSLIRLRSSYQSALHSVLSPISTDFTILCSILRNILNTHSSKCICALRDMLTQMLSIVRYKIYHRKSKVEVCCIGFSNLFVTLNNHFP